MSQIDRVRTLFGGVTGLPGVCTMYFDPSEGLNPQDLGDRISLFWSGFLNYIRSGLTITVDPVVESVDSTTGLVTSATGITQPTIRTGTNSADPLPPANNALVQLRTGVYFTGRELRGRYYIPGICEGDSTGGLLASGLRGVLQTAAQSLADDADQIVYSPTKHQFADVSTCSVWDQFAVLRSRRD